MARIKSRSIRGTILGGTGSALSGIWSSYAWFNTASALPEDAGAFARMLADPPIYFPYLVLALCVVVLAWSLWPRRDVPEESAPGPIAPVASGPHSSAFGINSGTVNITHHAPAPTNPRKHPRGLPSRPPSPPARKCLETPIWKAVRQAALAIGDTDQNQSYPRARQAVRQAALEGRLEVWGQKDIPPQHYQDERHSTAWTEIKPNYWEEYELNQVATAEFHSDQDHTWEEDLKSRRGKRYWSLKVDQAEIDKEWPKPRETTNDGKP